MAAITQDLDPGLTWVATSAALEHKRPARIGAEVEVEAELTEVDGRRLVFRFIARQKRRPRIARRPRRITRKRGTGTGTRSWRPHHGTGAGGPGAFRQSRPPPGDRRRGLTVG